MVAFPTPRYDLRQIARAGEFWCAWDTATSSFVYGAETQCRHEAQRTVDALNREYQRWLTDKFYADAEQEIANA